jgi:exopolyphosphatase/guanosine-5'-triphosphate,3'-diphosphate pyrophosphatase
MAMDMSIDIVLEPNQAQPEPSPKAGSTLAAVDVGTNSLHLVVARVTGDATFEVVAREKEMVRLGSGAGDMKVLTDDAIDRAVSALDRFRKIAAIDGAPLRAVATSAVREAENAQVFISRARLEAGVEVEVISGIEEARLIHLGVLQAVPVYDQRLVLCDIGGGSTELLIGERGEVLTARSFKVGAVRLTNRFFPGELDHPGAAQACRDYVRSAIAPMVREAETYGFEVAIGSSGTIEQLAELCHVLGSGDKPLRSYGNHTFTREQLDVTVGRLIKAGSVAARRKLTGMDPDRADIIMAGAIILEQVVHELGILDMTVSDFALREGVLLDTLQRTRGGTIHHLRDVSQRSVMALAIACDDEIEHSTHVAALAVRLFDDTAQYHRLPSPCREYLEAGALLANVGLFISHSKHHLHSYYVIRNSERLVGFTDNEVEMIAQIARYHRKSEPKHSHSEFARLSSDNQKVVRTLAGLLRVAIGLDRTQEGRVMDVTVVEEGQGVLIEAIPSSADVDLTLDLYAANERRSLLELVLDRPVRVAAAGS